MLVAVAPGRDVDMLDETTWTSELVGATYDASQGVRAEWTALTALWPAQAAQHLDIKPRLSADGGLLVFERVANDSTRTLLSSVRSVLGQWSDPIAIVESYYPISLYRIDRAPTGEVLLVYGVRYPPSLP